MPRNRYKSLLQHPHSSTRYQLLTGHVSSTADSTCVINCRWHVCHQLLTARVSSSANSTCNENIIVAVFVRCPHTYTTKYSILTHTNATQPAAAASTLPMRDNVQGQSHPRAVTPQSTGIHRSTATPFLRQTARASCRGADRPEFWSAQ